ncbi:MAG: radical SAM protein [Deltaproteobacteria bacterium]|nr:radical SAM protein [Deltaproteobacteria bacterium]
MNPAVLKLELMAYGIRPGEGLFQPLANPFGLVHLTLPEKLAVSIHLQERSPYSLHNRNNRFFLEKNGETIPVQWTPPLKAYEKKTSSGLAIKEILTVHGGLIAVHPKGPCRFGLSGLSCRYCGSTKALNEHPPFTKKDLVEAIEMVLEEKRCDFVNLSSGRVTSDDGGVEWLTPWVVELRKHLHILISLDLALPRSLEWIDKTYAIGVDALYYDLDFFNPDETRPATFQEQRDLHWKALEQAAKIFPAGAVLSHLVIGFEPLEETQKRIDLLIGKGVVPILVYFPPLDGSPLSSRWKITPQEIQGLYARLFEKLTQTGLNPHWVQQRDVILTPLEGRFLSDQPARYPLALQNFYETSLGRIVTLGLASLRRHLRVREVPAP